jgi:outer membrane lipoprotein-sorting protein
MIISLFIVITGIESITANYNKIQTLQAEIAKSIYISEEQNSPQYTEQSIIGKIYLKKPNKMAIRYAKPEQTIILNDTVVWVYWPSAKKVMKKNYNELSEMERKLMDIETIMGINPVQGFEETFDFEAKDESTIVGKTKGDPEIISKVEISVDPNRNIILGVKIFNTQEELISFTKCIGWEKINDVWFPQKMSSETYIQGRGNTSKCIREETQFSHIKINQEISESVFEFKPSKEIKIIE